MPRATENTRSISHIENRETGVMNLGIIVQARMSSTRLPGKILKDFYRGHTLLDIILQKLHRIPDAVVVVATSTNEADDALAT